MAAAKAYSNLSSEEKKDLKRVFEETLDEPISERAPSSFKETRTLSRKNTSMRINAN